MGRSGSSSKRRHSKKKSLKVSSEARIKKRSRRTKSKKKSRHDDSPSSYFDDESTSSSLYSFPDSEDDYRTRKSRSHSRNEVKSSKKRTRRRSSSEDSTNDSKKRKRSKKRSDYEKKKNKKKIKKKSRKDTYISSSDSPSCSTCGHEDSNSDEDTSKGKNGKRKNKRSLSPNSYDDYNIETTTVENNPRRLKSVITIVEKIEEIEDDMKRDELKEEMVYDHDYDYPSCKSNDSNDEDTKKESLVEKENLESEEVKDDLELILRKKALENLNRFRGGIQTKPVVNVDKEQKIGQSGVDQSQSQSQTPVSQPEIQRSRFTWRRDTSVSNLKEEKVENKIKNEVENKIKNEVENKIKNEVEKSTVVETPSNKEESSKGQESQNNESSQFKEKRMSVMRGGEMVQVSYKVYIPNKAPALARRQLKR